MAIATLMADPAFTNELLVVRKLQEENAWLKTQYTILKQMMDKVGVKAPRKRAPAKKKAAAAPRVKGGTAAQRQAFQDGFNDLRYPHGS
jgi:regulator of replication initiation timing